HLPPPHTAASLPLPTRRPPTSPLFPYTTLFRSPRPRPPRPAPAGGSRRWRRRRPRAAAAGRRPARPRGQYPWARGRRPWRDLPRSEEHTSELQSRENLVCRLLLEKKKKRDYVVW